MKTISVSELKKKIDRGDSFLLLDVREPAEYAAANLNGRLIPLGDLPFRLDELEPFKQSEIVVHCRSGQRSSYAVMILQENGFTNVCNLIGGILAWKADIDPSLPIT